MSANTPTPTPLQPRGAGLPWLELTIARLLVGWQARRSTRQQAADLFNRERDNVLALVRDDRGEADVQPVLIPRLRGMEDSSRDWSVCMTLDHLRIVNAGTGGLIRLLGHGKTPERATGTADVKPAPGVGREVIGEFARACECFEQSVAAVADPRATPRWPHPWFGPLDAADWHFFTAFHMRLHRGQIETIRKVQRRV